MCIYIHIYIPPGTVSSSITTHTPSEQRNCSSWVSQTQKSVTLLPCPGGRTTKSTKDMWWHWTKKIYIYIHTHTHTQTCTFVCLCVCVCVCSRASVYLSMHFRLFVSKFACVCVVTYVQLLLITSSLFWKGSVLNYPVNCRYMRATITNLSLSS